MPAHTRKRSLAMNTHGRSTAKTRAAHIAARLPGLLRYHQSMLADGVRNRLLLEAMTRAVRPGCSFLDVGAGTGVWAIQAAKLGASRVVALEIEESLIPIIRKHAVENGVADRIEIVRGNADDYRVRSRFDVIVAEIFGQAALGEPTARSLMHIRDRLLAPGGVLIPVRLELVAAPARVLGSTDGMPAGLAISSRYVERLGHHYLARYELADRHQIENLAPPAVLTTMDLRTMTSAPQPHYAAQWPLDDISAVDAVVVSQRLTFAEGVVLDALQSRSWMPSVYRFTPIPVAAGVLAFELSQRPPSDHWTISVPTHHHVAKQTMSQQFAVAAIALAARTTPVRRLKPRPHRRA